jgi:hypothetical protein
MRRYIKLHTAIRTNPKFLGLSTDGDRLRYIEALLAAQETEPSGEWIGDSYYLAGTGHSADTLDTLLGADLLRRTEDGLIIVPQWRLWQAADHRVPAAHLDRDNPDALAKLRASAAERQRRHRQRDHLSHDLSRDMSRLENKEIDSSVTGVTEDAARSGPLEGPTACARCGGVIDDGAGAMEVMTPRGMRQEHYPSCPSVVAA